MALRDSFGAAPDGTRPLRPIRNWGAGWLGLAGPVYTGYLPVDGVLMPSYTRHDVSIQVPDVENQPFEEARSLLRDQDLRVEREVGRYNPNVDQNVVVDQTPLPTAKVKPGRRVYLTVNAGEIPTVSVPDLNGMSVREAKNRVSSLGLVVGSVQEDSFPSPYANTITKQSPTPGDSVQEGTEVDLWYSTGLGDETVETPNVVGRTVERARRALRQRRLRAVIVDTSSTDREAPLSPDSLQDETPESELYVRRQGRSPGTSVRAGTELRLFVTTDAEEAAQRRTVIVDTVATDSTAQ